MCFLLSALFGSLLGDMNGSWPKSQLNPYFSLSQGEVHSAYLLYLWDFFCTRGYTTKLVPNALTRYFYKPFIRSYSLKQDYRQFTIITLVSLNWLFFYFYPNAIRGDVGIKVVPSNDLLFMYLCIYVFMYLCIYVFNTFSFSYPRYWMAIPNGIAIFVMDDRTRLLIGGIRLNTHSFTYSELNRLKEVLLKMYGLVCTIHSTNEQDRGGKVSYYLYVTTNSMPCLAKLISPYLDPSMLYKIRGVTF
uniref:LAGLIDADG endonuclease n=1 Tax=Spizellomyces sp. 'palustris' TaxID=117820 RepID=UPI0010FBFEBB|nr:LAGLIDADG endonuclease [Spizellomyces sp. 'palustris']QCQ69054.1 LAGLIDADG endonuclease [Spizellomyces sp. 'palustris']